MKYIQPIIIALLLAIIFICLFFKIGYESGQKDMRDECVEAYIKWCKDARSRPDFEWKKEVQDERD